MISVWITLPVVFLLCGAALVCITAAAIARALLRPPRMSDGKAMYLLRRLSPADLGLAFEPITFNVRDAAQSERSTLAIAGWWIPAEPSADGTESDRCAILLHGYADAKVGAIAWAPLFHSLGFNCLAIDLRAHGESGGMYSTAGWFERHDVAQVIDGIRAQQPRGSTRIILFGASLGAAVALATVAMLDQEARDRSGGAREPGNNGAIHPSTNGVDALVLDCPYADFARAAALHGDRLGTPRRFVTPLAMAFADAISGARLRSPELSPLELLNQVRAPLLLIHVEHDENVSDEDIAALGQAVHARASLGAPRVFWRTDGADHLRSYAVDPAGYEMRLRQFLASALAESPSRIADHGTPCHP